MSETTHLYGSRADLLDTGQWHLAIDISKSHFGAWLLAEQPSMRPPRILASERWEASEEGLLHRIEDIVYDHPAVLDDYSADIVIESDRQLWLPASEYPTDEECADAYTKIYGGEPYDVMVNDLGDTKVAFMLTTGLKSFMQRSFPGARIWSQQSLLKEAGMAPHDDYKCLIDIRENYADFILLKRGHLQCATSHPWKTSTDIIYRLFALLKVFNAAADKTDLILSGYHDIRHEIGDSLKEFIGSISQKNHDVDGVELPTGVGLAIKRKTRKCE